MKDWIKKHKVIAGVVVVAILWIIYRVSRGLSLSSAGHTSPHDAISYGWSVFQAGITGWLEVSPDGATSIMHDTGWVDPYKTA